MESPARCTISRTSEETRTDQVSVPSAVVPVEREARARGIDLEVEHGRLDGLLFVVGEARECVREGISDSNHEA